MKKHIVPGEDLDPWHPGDDYIYHTPCVVLNNIDVEINSNDNGYNFACFVEDSK